MTEKPDVGEIAAAHIGGLVRRDDAGDDRFVQQSILEHSAKLYVGYKAAWSDPSDAEETGDEEG